MTNVHIGMIICMSSSAQPDCSDAGWHRLAAAECKAFVCPRSNAEMANMRKMCDQLQRQLCQARQTQSSSQTQNAIDFSAIIAATDHGHNAPNGEDLSIDSKRKVILLRLLCHVTCQRKVQDDQEAIF